MEYVKAKSKEISFEKESMQKSMDTALLRQKELQKKVSQLTNKVVSTSVV